MKINVPLTIAVCALGLSLSGTAEVPQSINYQGRLLTQAGMPMVNETNNPADGQIDLVFQIFDAPTGGNSVWSQVQPDVAVYNGLFSVLLNNLNATIFPATNQISRWLEVEVRAGAITNILQPRKEMVSVAYAIRASDADMVDGKHASELGGITNEVDPTVTNWVKDGVSWAELKGQGMPAGFTDDVDNVGITNWAELTTNGMPAGFADGIDDAGITVETDPTTTNWVKDGVSWAELKGQGMPAGFTDDVDNVGITNWVELTTNGMPAGFADGIDDEGITAETDPTVTNWVKDGVSWAELKGQGMPAGFTDDVDNVGITNWVELTTNGMPAGFADGIDDEGITAETDPTTTNWVKDGVSWAELKGQGMPAGFTDDVDNVGITNWAELTTNGMPAGFADGIDDVGVTNWTQLKAYGMPPEFADDVDNVGITNEVDPQVDDAMTLNSVPRWDGAKLITGNIYNDPAGNVGIGTTGPAGLLHIAGSSPSAIIIQATTAGAARLDYWAYNRGYITSRIEGQEGGAVGRGFITFWNRNDAGTLAENMRIDGQNGNVGIGTVTPSQKLEISGVYSDPSLTHGAAAIISIRSTIGTESVIGSQQASPYTTWIQVRNDTLNGYSYPLALNPLGGNVGIGTTSPGYKLHVAGDIYANGGWLRTSGSQGWYSETYEGGWFMQDSSWIRTYNSKSVWTADGLLGGNGGLTIGYGGNGSPAGGAIIAGNVGIGTPSPAYKLDVNGNAMIRGGTLVISAGDHRIQTLPDDFLGKHQFLALRAEDNMTVLVPGYNGFRVTNHSPRNNLVLTDALTTRSWPTREGEIG